MSKAEQRTENPRVGDSTEARSADSRTQCARRASKASPFRPETVGFGNCSSLMYSDVLTAAKVSALPAVC